MAYTPPAAAWTSQTDAKSTYRTTKSIAQMVRDATNGGQMLIDALVDMVTNPDAHPRDRATAIGMLMDRGFGRAVETTLSLSVDASQSDALSQLADAELERLAQTLAPHTVRPVVVLPAQALSPALDSLPDAPPEALEAPLRPLEPVTALTRPVAETPVTPLPPPLARAPRRRIVVHRPPVSGQASLDTTQYVVDRSDIDPKG
jgi:hypothetical protein